jgi:hypothetical protein
MSEHTKPSSGTGAAILIILLTLLSLDAVNGNRRKLVIMDSYRDSVYYDWNMMIKIGEKAVGIVNEARR